MNRLFRVHAVTTLILVLAMAITSALTPAASAQLRSRSFTTEDGRHEVEWSRDWDADEDLTTEEDGVAMVSLTSRSTMVAFMFVPSFGLDASDAFDLFHDTFIEGMGGEVTEVDQWEDRGVTHSLDIVDADGLELAAYMRIEETGRGRAADLIISVLATLPSSFERSLTSVQEEITVDGAGAFEGVSASELMMLLDEAATSASGDGDRDGRSQEPGEAGSYTDSARGYTVTWSDAWREEADAGVNLFLIHEDGEATLSFAGMDMRGMDRSVFIRTTQARHGGVSATSLGTVVEDDRALTAMETSGGDVLILELIFLPDDQVVVVTALLAGDADMLAEEIQDGVEIEDEPVLRDWESLGR